MQVASTQLYHKSNLHKAKIEGPECLTNSGFVQVLKISFNGVDGGIGFSHDWSDKPEEAPWALVTPGNQRFLVWLEDDWTPDAIETIATGQFIRLQPHYSILIMNHKV